MESYTKMMLLTVGITLGFAGPIFAGDTLCPKSISVKQKITSLPSSWEAFPEALPYQLKSVSFFEGHPKNRVALVNDNSEIVDGKNEIATWNFISSTKGYWVECIYDQTNIALTKRLAKNVSQCRVTYERNVTISGVQQIREIACK
jgi:hypothetical protein